MREILFRGKVLSTGGWIFGTPIKNKLGTYIVFEKNPHYCSQYGYMEISELALVDPETVGQFTGLTDKNGTLIFEGDVFKFLDEIWESAYTSCGTEYNSWEIENYGVVGFCEDTGRFEFVDYRFHENSVEADLHENRNLEFPDFVRELEIVGNIHDHPKLLEVDYG